MAGDSLTDPGSSYSPAVGFFFIFNLIVGTGALTLPKAFSQAGYVLGTIVLSIIGFMSYISATFVLESMSNANAILRIKKFDTSVGKDEETESSRGERESSPEIISDHEPLIDTRELLPEDSTVFQIRKRIELGQMAGMFYRRIGIYLFYACMVIYLFGDLAIYATAVPKSLRDIACTFVNGSSVFNMTEDDPCWATAENLSRRNAYRIFVAVFACTLGPFLFFNVQKTKYLQIVTSATRWVALIMMIILAIIWIAEGKNEGHPVVADLTAFPNIFGTAVYAFMCHHSLPGVVTPIRHKSRVYGLIFGDYFSALCLYLLLALTGVFLYKQPKDLYTLNFFDVGDKSQIAPDVIRYFLALFPVFTLSSTFPIVGITLRNNIRTLFGLFTKKDFPWMIEKFAFPLITLIPPICIALLTDEVQILVGITGSYAGCGIQYVIPAMMVYCSRKMVLRLIPDTAGTKLPYRSPFHHFFWIVLINMWAFASIVVITVNHIIYRK
ncbi:transmembrane protein 104-like [Paramacrobiotus metropolitanus]|uniref:transmembrane protein 104-like n=1 Tax=Paramacrobiotus metropolitanus TaxID=2943436 RepID=UPI002445948D|nr:transmembrane protein 104-like [Paramacrobiotus metropolitanus]